METGVPLGILFPQSCTRGNFTWGGWQQLCYGAKQTKEEQAYDRGRGTSRKEPALATPHVPPRQKQGKRSQGSREKGLPETRLGLLACPLERLKATSQRVTHWNSSQRKISYFRKFILRNAW